MAQCLRCSNDLNGDSRYCSRECVEAALTEAADVLEFYADDKRHVDALIDADSGGMHSRVFADHGEKARKVLGDLGRRCR